MRVDTDISCCRRLRMLLSTSPMIVNVNETPHTSVGVGNSQLSEIIRQGKLFANIFICSPGTAEPSPRTDRRKQSLSRVGSMAERTPCLCSVRLNKLLSCGTAPDPALFTPPARSPVSVTERGPTEFRSVPNGQSRARMRRVSDFRMPPLPQRYID